MTNLTNSYVSARRVTARLIYNQPSEVAMVCEYVAVVVTHASVVTCNHTPCQLTPLAVISRGVPERDSGRHRIYG